MANLPSENTKPHYFLMNIVIFGDEAVGKTSICECYAEPFWSESYQETIGADFAIKWLSIGDKQIKFQIWDLKGGSRFEKLRLLLFRGALGGILVFDVTCEDSFENLPQELKKFWQGNCKIIPVVVLGNKIDLRNKIPNTVSSEEAEALCEKLSAQTIPHGFRIPYLETSAKTGQNIAKSFEILLQMIYESVGFN